MFQLTEKPKSRGIFGRGRGNWRVVSAPKKPMAAAESPAEVTAGPAGPEPRPPPILPVPCPRCGTFDVTRADLGAAMIKPVVTATLPEDAAFHFHSQR